jgi:hypothetical protein
MKKYYFLIIVVLILGLVLTGCSLLSNVGQVPTSEQSGVTYLTKSLPLLPNLVGLWHFDEGSGDTAVDSSNGNDGTITGATYTGSANAMFGDALSFDGENDYVDCGAAVDDSITTGITLEAWIKCSYTNTYDGGIISNDLTWISKKGYDFFIENGKLGIDVGNGTKVGRVLYTMPTLSLADPVWQHVAATWDGSTVRLYVDGAEVGTPASLDGTYSDPGKDTFVGKINTLSNYQAYIYPFQGLIDEVCIWDISLTDFQLEPVPVAMDIKPGSCPNPLNVKNQGVLPVAILGTENFDVNDIDPSTILLEGVKPVRWAFEDVATPPFEPSIGDGEPDCFNCTEEGPDGFLDLTLKFETQEVLGVLGFGTMALVDESEIILSNDRICRVITLTGYLYDGTPISGEDTVLIINKGK